MEPPAAPSRQCLLCNNKNTESSDSLNMMLISCCWITDSEPGLVYWSTVSMQVIKYVGQNFLIVWIYDLKTCEIYLMVP